MVACAILPAISCLYILASNAIDELNAFTLLSTSLENLPAHIIAIVIFPFFYGSPFMYPNAVIAVSAAIITISTIIFTIVLFI